MTSYFPPPGAKCADCDCCDANVYAGNVPLCWACDAGEPCPIRGVVCKPTEATAPEAKTADKQPAKRRKGQHLSNELKVAIRSEPRSISHNKVARKYGVSDMTVRNLRKQFGGKQA